MGSVVKWAKFNNWSGPWIRGTCPYVVPEVADGFDVIAAATTRPEGGAYDTVVMYDGTAVTWGMAQWTFTSGRLHKLLIKVALELLAKEGPASYWTTFGDQLKQVTNLRVNVKDGHLYLGDKVVIDYFTLRDVCTPPGGQCPQTGSKREKANAIARLFSKLGENPLTHPVQIQFLHDELQLEATYKRPRMGGATIAEYLYPNGWDDLVTPDYLCAARALFWGMWQNAPRKAEELLDKAARGVFLPLNSQAHLERLAKLYAYTQFARWGVEKAKKADKPYQSRYQKVASEINKVMGQKIVPEYWK